MFGLWETYFRLQDNGQVVNIVSESNLKITRVLPTRPQQLTLCLGSKRSKSVKKKKRTDRQTLLESTLRYRSPSGLVFYPIFGVNKRQAEIFFFSAARICSPLCINWVCVNGFLSSSSVVFVPFEFLSHFFCSNSKWFEYCNVLLCTSSKKV